MTTLVSTLTIFIKTLIKHLWLSISSARFYQDVFYTYQGYGTKYILTLSIISSLICNIIFLGYVGKIQKYLSDDIISERVVNIDHVIRQLPTINYNGKDISISEDLPSVIIYGMDNTKILAIDPAGKLSNNDKIKIPVLLTKDEININLKDFNGKTKNTLPIKYTQIFGPQAQILNKETIKSSFIPLFKRAPTVLTYIIFPLTTIMIFITHLFEKSFMIVVVFIISRFRTEGRSLKDSIRVVLFSSGFCALFQSVASLVSIELNYVLWVLQTWANILMIIGIMRLQDRITFSSK
jgi:hypothetical protein